MRAHLLRKCIALLAAISAVLLLSAAASQARPMGMHVGHVGYGHAHFVGRPFFGRPFFRAGFVGPYYAGVYPSCWHWQPTPFGWRRVWACGYPYYPYGWPY
jgi:hypothetical protein